MGLKEIIIAYNENTEASNVMGDWVGELVRCKDCKHRPKEPNWETLEDGFIEFPKGSKCPCKCSGDEFYSWYPEDNWYCAYGVKKDG